MGPRWLRTTAAASQWASGSPLAILPRWVPSGENALRSSLASSASGRYWQRRHVAPYENALGWAQTRDSRGVAWPYGPAEFADHGVAPDRRALGRHSRRWPGPALPQLA